MGVCLNKLRHIQASLIAEGAACPVLTCEVSQTRAQNSDSFSASLSITACPPGRQADYWSSVGEVDIQIRASIGAGAHTIFEGLLDAVDIDFAQHTVRLRGRDKSKRPIENKRNESWKNRTASEIVQQIAGEHGLQPVIDSLSDRYGKVYENDFVAISDQLSDWTLLQHIADREGKVVYVRGGKLYFKEIDDATFGAITVHYSPPTPASHASGNFIQLACTRNVQAGKSTDVEVKSWNSKEKKAVAAKRSRSGTGPGQNKHLYRHEGLTQAQADKMADKRLREAVRHEMQVRIDMPGEPHVTPEHRLILTGTGTAFDQAYFIDSVRHAIGDGYRMSISAKNTKEGGGKAANKAAEKESGAVGGRNVTGGAKFIGTKEGPQ